MSATASRWIRSRAAHLAVQRVDRGVAQAEQHRRRGGGGVRKKRESAEEPCLEQRAMSYRGAGNLEKSNGLIFYFSGKSGAPPTGRPAPVGAEQVARALSVDLARHSSAPPALRGGSSRSGELHQLFRTAIEAWLDLLTAAIDARGPSLRLNQAVSPSIPLLSILLIPPIRRRLSVRRLTGQATLPHLNPASR